MGKISVIISSYNQCNRLRLCLDSAVKMKTKFSDSVEIIVADDNSTDGSVELIKQYPVMLCMGDNDCSGKYTLTENWNKAAKLATGDRVLFTNGDHILTTYFADHHMDPVMRPNIIFGPAYQTDSRAEPVIVSGESHLDVVKILEQKKLLLPDRRAAHQLNSAMTYNVEYTSDYPYGYNFSIPTHKFLHVGGFDVHRKWGGEEEILCDKILKAFPDTKIVSNCNSVNIHLWHPPVNMLNRTTGNLSDYNF